MQLHRCCCYSMKSLLTGVFFVRRSCVKLDIIDEHAGVVNAQTNLAPPSFAAATTRNRRVASAPRPARFCDGLAGLSLVRTARGNVPKLVFGRRHVGPLPHRCRHPRSRMLLQPVPQPKKKKERRAPHGIHKTRCRHTSSNLSRHVLQWKTTQPERWDVRVLW